MNLMNNDSQTPSEAHNSSSHGEHYFPRDDAIYNLRPFQQYINYDVSLEWEDLQAQLGNLKQVKEFLVLKLKDRDQLVKATTRERDDLEEAFQQLQIGLRIKEDEREERYAQAVEKLSHLEEMVGISLQELRKLQAENLRMNRENSAMKDEIVLLKADVKDTADNFAMERKTTDGAIIELKREKRLLVKEVKSLRKSLACSRECLEEAVRKEEGLEASLLSAKTNQRYWLDNKSIEPSNSRLGVALSNCAVIDLSAPQILSENPLTPVIFGKVTDLRKKVDFKAPIQDNLMCDVHGQEPKIQSNYLENGNSIKMIEDSPVHLPDNSSCLHFVKNDIAPNCEFARIAVPKQTISNVSSEIAETTDLKPNSNAGSIDGTEIDEVHLLIENDNAYVKPTMAWSTSEKHPVAISSQIYEGAEPSSNGKMINSDCSPEDRFQVEEDIPSLNDATNALHEALIVTQPDAKIRYNLNGTQTCSMGRHVDAGMPFAVKTLDNLAATKLFQNADYFSEKQIAAIPRNGRKSGKISDGFVDKEQAAKVGEMFGRVWQAAQTGLQKSKLQILENFPEQAKRRVDSVKAEYDAKMLGVSNLGMPKNQSSAPYSLSGSKQCQPSQLNSLKKYDDTRRDTRNYLGYTSPDIENGNTNKSLLGLWSRIKKETSLEHSSLYKTDYAPTKTRVYKPNTSNFGDQKDMLLDFSLGLDSDYDEEVDSCEKEQILIANSSICNENDRNAKATADDRSFSKEITVQQHLLADIPNANSEILSSKTAIAEGTTKADYGRLSNPTIEENITIKAESADAISTYITDSKQLYSENTCQQNDETTMPLFAHSSLKCEMTVESKPFIDNSFEN
ncbi:hypothetical protein IE077_002501 [Cardiosporidium cionae]|uniref:Uncharacterized protein n=1 Tax=Cardiosporidium cionae TaxID=476202 RepID=A0ABQ7JAP7_9APIC|nr:hypothetical protein IE077_002501 [Cardiosporidium cionae]|eukprot:KAF8821062.1 hypothetical protein IE077_002501 [Cardiosporidium cionae]